MNLIKLGNYVANKVEETIHYIRYNIAKDGEPISMLYVNMDGKMEIKPCNENLSYTSIEDISFYSDLISTIYTNSIKLLKGEKILRVGDKVIVRISSTSIYSGTIEKLDFPKSTVIVRTEKSSFDTSKHIKYNSYPMSDIIEISETHKIDELKNDRKTLIDQKVSDIDVKISYIEGKINRSTAIIKLIQDELVNIKNKELSENRLKSITQKSKCLRRLTFKVEKYTESLSGLSVDKKEVLKDAKFNECLPLLIK